uniref:Uncharacterized protein n=1 Tax=Arundo donax TaxID=35708 RepID=A0A0A9BLX0_ARUDO
MEPPEGEDPTEETLTRAIAFRKELEQCNDEFRAARTRGTVGMAAPTPGAARSGLLPVGSVHGASGGARLFLRSYHFSRDAEVPCAPPHLGRAAPPASRHGGVAPPPSHAPPPLLRLGSCAAGSR